MTQPFRPLNHGKASILAVGTELTTGQITNQNAAWISEQLVSLGVEVVLHLTVPDDRDRIAEALDQCAEKSQMIFVTGGLGPTTDDFTREVIAHWVNQPLEFHEASWKQIIDRLTRLGIRVAPSNRQQCFFPKGSQVISNPAGTAAAFTQILEKSKVPQQIWVLPGPPREVAAVWNQGISEQILALNPDLEPTVLLTWQCMGKSEAELGEITEKALQGSGLQTGYRAHPPFVEVKVWCTQEGLKEKEAFLSELRDQIAPWVITENGEDLARRLLLQLQGREWVDLLDSATEGALAQRVSHHLKKTEFSTLKKELTLLTEWAPSLDAEEYARVLLEESDPEATTLILSGLTSSLSAWVGLKSQGKEFLTEIQTPYQSPEMKERARGYITEIALQRWSEWLSTLSS